MYKQVATIVSGGILVHLAKRRISAAILVICLLTVGLVLTAEKLKLSTVLIHTGTALLAEDQIGM